MGKASGRREIFTKVSVWPGFVRRLTGQEQICRTGRPT
jgi:hypothetical protein